ncbi:MAG TPA: 30S ribosomal protein S27ae [Thermoplasmata archaeon]|nr:30S ribosomal protein S27ae [Thermoplasmata archaeon]
MPIHEYYEISGKTLKRKKESCPKCGDGVFLADHKDRKSCGKCGYTEFKKA